MAKKRAKKPLIGQPARKKELKSDFDIAYDFALGVYKKFDKIIEFADIGDFLDTPVKNYSSGMFVRLGFAIAVHCEPDILLVDEVLAVGDVGFRTKCYEKISELKEKSTIIFVSHSMDAIAKTCDRVILFYQGNLTYCGDTETAIEKYQDLFIKKDQKVQILGTGEAEIEEVQEK